MPMMWGKGSQEFGKRLTYPVTKNFNLLIELFQQYVTIKKNSSSIKFKKFPTSYTTSKKFYVVRELQTMKLIGE